MAGAGRLPSSGTMNEAEAGEATVPPAPALATGPSIEADADPPAPAAGKNGLGAGMTAGPPATEAGPSTQAGPPATAAAGPSTSDQASGSSSATALAEAESDEAVARRLQREDEDAAVRAQEARLSDEQNDAAIARQLELLDLESAGPALPAGAPAPEVEGDEALARALHAEELRAQRAAATPAPPEHLRELPVASAQAVSARGRVRVHRYVSDIEAVVGQIGTWFEHYVAQALDSHPASVGAAAAVPTAAGPRHITASLSGEAPAATAYHMPEGYGESSTMLDDYASIVLDDFASAHARLAHRQREVELISLGDPLSAPDEVRMDADLEELLLGRLCSLLSAVLVDGLTQPILGGIFQGGVRSPWSLFEAWASSIEARCESEQDERTRAKPSASLIGLLKAVRRANQLYEESIISEIPPAAEFKLRTLVCYGLNVGELHEWVAMLALDGPSEQLFEWYESDSFVNQRETVLLLAEKLVPLADQPFRLPLHLECRQLTRDSAVYGFSATQPAHSWL
ncbi:hypothetical protein T492DRAFT_900721 [Pavlovales sp. CCMP2436]|nr:hypothetical protein T492DRAFT_900721 [Pavlovales sp. CCMP2436]|mmetsp:Transcript_29408/g.68859  ORF Transcript_29408/g.68859 Transcript_29408/m.68859 type:complete len:516 (-) Transcript_29408:72-1619(-)